MGTLGIMRGYETALTHFDEEFDYTLLEPRTVERNIAQFHANVAQYAVAEAQKNGVDPNHPRLQQGLERLLEARNAFTKLFEEHADAMEHLDQTANAPF